MTSCPRILAQTTCGRMKAGTVALPTASWASRMDASRCCRQNARVRQAMEAPCASSRHGRRLGPVLLSGCLVLGPQGLRHMGWGGVCMGHVLVHLTWASVCGSVHMALPHLLGCWELPPAALGVEAEHLWAPGSVCRLGTCSRGWWHTSTRSCPWAVPGNGLGGHFCARFDPQMAPGLEDRPVSE